jgi:hypothetical protein
MPQLRYTAFDPIHHLGHICGDGQITPPQLFLRAESVLSVVDRLELVGAAGNQGCHDSAARPRIAGNAVTDRLVVCDPRKRRC